MFNLQIQFWATSLILIGISQYGSTAYLRCYGRNMDDFHQTSLDDPISIIGSSCYDASLPTVFYAFDFLGTKTALQTTTVINALLAKKDRNVILVDWEDEAANGLLGVKITYGTKAVPKAAKIGENLGYALVQLDDAGMKTDKVHLVGFGVGAHLMGYAGRKARSCGHVVSRITGLDPSSALFEDTFTLYKGLRSTSAEFVDVIHTDNHHYGINKAIGTADFWINYKDDRQPGCPTGELVKFTYEDFCSHHRAWEIFVETLTNEGCIGFQASNCVGDCVSSAQGDDHSEGIIYLGDPTVVRARGNFYLRTNSTPPYGIRSEPKIDARGGFKFLL